MTKNELLTMLGLSEKEILDILKPVRTKKTNEEKTLIQVMNLVVEKRNEIPILSNFKIDKTNIRGTDMENQLILKNIIDSNVQTTVHINNLEMVLKNECKLIEIPIDIKEYKNNLPSEKEAKFCGDKLEVGNRILNTLPFQDFPSMDVQHFPILSNFKIDNVELLKAINFCLPAVSKEETRYYLNGIYFESIDGFLNLIGTDGHRLNSIKTSIPYKNKAFIAPTKSCKILQKLLTLNYEINMRSNDERVLFRSHKFDFIFKVIDGNYPDYEKVIPKDNNQEILLTTTATELRNLKSDKTKGAKISNGNIICMNDGEISTIKDCVNKFDFEIGFNISYLATILDAMKGLKYEIKASDGTSPILFKAENARCILMPTMRV